MTNQDIDDEEWGNIELPGVPDEVLYNTNWNRVAALYERWSDPDTKARIVASITEANKRKAEDPEWLRKTTEANKRKAEDPDWQKRNSEGAKRRSEDPEWRKNQVEAGKRRAEDPDWRRKQAAGAKRNFADPDFRKRQADGIRRKFEDPEYRKKKSEATKKAHSMPIQTPAGIFPSRKAAAAHYGVTPALIGYWAKTSKPTEYYYLPKELNTPKEQIDDQNHS